MTAGFENLPTKRHVVRSFDEDIELIRRKIVEMGGVVEQQVVNATESLLSRNVELAQKVIERDPQVDAMEEEIDQIAIRLLATRQPMAIDLRVIAMSLKISNDLERMSDYAVSIAKRGRNIAAQNFMPMLPTMSLLADTCQEMIKEVLDAYIETNETKAMAVWQRDADVDAAYSSLFRVLLTFMLEDTRNITTCIDFMFCAKNLERIGDHCTNIAEKIHYVIHGEQINRTRGDES